MEIAQGTGIQVARGPGGAVSSPSGSRPGVAPAWPKTVLVRFHL